MDKTRRDRSLLGPRSNSQMRRPPS
jgi:hypothetical protein